MSHCTATETRVARTTHECAVCGEPIHKGTTHARWAGTTDGYWWSVRAHFGCVLLLHDAVKPEAEHRTDECYIPWRVDHDQGWSLVWYGESLRDKLIDGCGEWFEDYPLRAAILVGEHAAVRAAMARLPEHLMADTHAALAPIFHRLTGPD